MCKFGDKRDKIQWHYRNQSPLSLKVNIVLHSSERRVPAFSHLRLQLCNCHWHKYHIIPSPNIYFMQILLEQLTVTLLVTFPAFLERQSSRFKVQEILTMMPIPNDVILVRTSKSFLHKIIIIIIIIIPGFSHQNSDLIKQQIIQVQHHHLRKQWLPKKLPKQMNNSLLF